MTTGTSSSGPVRTFLSTGQKSKAVQELLNAVGEVDQNAPKVVVPVAEDAFRAASMFLDLDGVLRVEPLAHQMGPTKRDGQDRHEFADAGGIGHVGRFEPEPAGLQTPKEGLDFPSFGVVIQGRLGTNLRGDDQILLRGEAKTDNVEAMAPHAALAGQQEILVGPQRTEQLRCPDESALGIGDLRITLDANAKHNALGFQVRKPVFADEFSVRREAGDLVRAKDVEKSRDESDSLRGVGVALLIEGRPKKGAMLLLCRRCRAVRC